MKSKTKSMNAHDGSVSSVHASLRSVR